MMKQYAFVFKRCLILCDKKDTKFHVISFLYKYNNILTLPILGSYISSTFQNTYL